MADLPLLTRRERQVLIGVREGLANKEIAAPRLSREVPPLEVGT